MKITSFLYLIFIAIIFNSCENDDIETGYIETGYIEAETKEFTVFKQGTLWMYKNLNSNYNDTWKVYRFENWIEPAGDDINFRSENTEIHISTSQFDTFRFNVIGNYVTMMTPKYNLIVQVCYFNYKTNFLGACDNNKIRLIDSDSIDGKCMNKVMDIHPYPCTNIFPKHFTWKRHIGLERMVYPNGDTLVLIEHKIIQ